MCCHFHNSSKSRNVASASTAELLAVVFSTLMSVVAPDLLPLSSCCAIPLLCSHSDWRMPTASSNTSSIRLPKCTTSSVVASPFRRHCLVAASIKNSPIRNPNDPHSIFNLLLIVRLDSLSRSELLLTFSPTPSSLSPSLPTFSLPSFIRFSN